MLALASTAPEELVPLDVVTIHALTITAAMLFSMYMFRARNSDVEKEGRREASGGSLVKGRTACRRGNHLVDSEIIRGTSSIEVWGIE